MGWTNSEVYLLPYTLHTQAAGEKKPTLELNIRTLKDRTKSTVQLLPYRRMPLMMIDSIAEQAQSMLNDFSSKIGIYTTMSSRNSIEGRPNLYYNTMFLKLGAYIQLFEGTNNTQRSLSVGAVTLNPYT